MRLENASEMDGFLTRLRSGLEGDLPGREAQYRMAPGTRRENEHARYKNAAILILLYKKDNRIWTVLMKRPEYPGEHSNQVSFPGGKSENADRDLRDTALRETKEELGIDESRIEILGRLSPLEIPVSGIEVLPFVGYYPGVPQFNPDPAEVQYLIETPLSDLLRPETRQVRIRTILCKLVKVPCYEISGNDIWGATAMILSEFLEVILKTDPSPPR